MAKARIQLKGAMSHTARGRRVEKGKPFYTTNAADIAYYKAQGGFLVTMLEEDKPKPAPKRKPAPPPEPETEPEGGDEGDDEESDDLTNGSYTKSDLMAIKKADLATLAKDDFDLDLDPDNLNKSQMVAAILKAQIDAFEDEDE